MKGSKIVSMAKMLLLLGFRKIFGGRDDLCFLSLGISSEVSHSVLEALERVPATVDLLRLEDAF